VPTCTVGESVIFAHGMASAGRESLANKDAPKDILQRLGLAELWDTRVCF
jgi:hypothetical protein